MINGGRQIKFIPSIANYFKVVLMKKNQKYLQNREDLKSKQISLFSCEAEQKLRQISLANLISCQNDYFQEWAGPKKKNQKRRIKTASCDARSERSSSHIRTQLIPVKISPIMDQQLDLFSKKKISSKINSLNRKQTAKKTYSTFVYNFKCNQKQRIHSSQFPHNSLDQLKPLYPPREPFLRSTSPCINFKPQSLNTSKDININSHTLKGNSINQLSLRNQNRLTNGFTGKKRRLQSYSKDRHKQTMKMLTNNDKIRHNHLYTNVCHLKGANIKIQRKQILRFSYHQITLP